MTDVARIASAVERPGIDPRTNASIAIVEKVVVDAVGVHVDIVTVTGIEETATVSNAYAGNGYGFYMPLEVGQAVYFILPEGEWAAGARIIGQVWDQGDPPPALIALNPSDPAFVIKAGRTFRIVASDGGAVVIATDETSRIELAAEGATDRMARASDFEALREILTSDEFVAAIASIVADPTGNTYKAAVNLLFASNVFGSTKIFGE